MSHGPISLAAIRETRSLLGTRIHHTPMLSSATAARVAGHNAGTVLADGRLYLKAEHLQKTGSFKPRAALARIASLTADERRRGAITISAGNAGQAYAWAAREAGVPMTVVMPAGAVASKVAACLEYGADVVLHGAHVGEALQRLEEIRAERGLALVHPYDDPEVLLGNGSCGLEILEDLPDVDVLVIAVGGGGLLGGVAVAVRESRPRTRIFAVEPRGSDALGQAMAAGEPVRLTPTSVADGLNAPSAGRLALDDRRPIPRGRGRDRRRHDPLGSPVLDRAAQAGRGARGSGGPCRRPDGGHPHPQRGPRGGHPVRRQRGSRPSRSPARRGRPARRAPLMDKAPG